MPILIGQSLGRYHILEQLGEGGMATVYKAYDTRLERDVAIKVIRVDQFAPSMLERILKRFEREAKAVAKLSHPNIVKILDYGEQDGLPFLVMEFLPGGTLKQRLGKPIPWQEAVKLMLPIAEALDYSHSQNIIHRDIKPSNILLTQRGQSMLTDFGIAKILESEETQTLTGTGVGIGTPEYMAPEQWTGHAGPQSDLYSLGVVLYELVTGRRPYTADTPAAIMLKHVNDPLPRPRQFAHDLPEKVEKVIIKSLAKKTEDRYHNMSEFIASLGNLLSEQTTKTRMKFEGSRKKEEKETRLAGSGKQEEEETQSADGGKQEEVRYMAEQKKLKDRYLNKVEFGAAQEGLPSSQLNDGKVPPVIKTTQTRNSFKSGEKRRIRKWLWILITLVVLGVSISIGGRLWHLGRQGIGLFGSLATRTPTSTFTLTPTLTLIPTFTLTPTFTKTLTPTSSRTSTPTETPQYTFSVSARQDWQATKVTVQKGQTITIGVISGQWTGQKGHSPYNTGEGTSYICANYIAASSCVEPLPTFPSDGLIGKIGNWIFAVGNHATIVAQVSGILQFRINDGPGASLNDNDGTLFLDINVH